VSDIFLSASVKDAIYLLKHSHVPGRRFWSYTFVFFFLAILFLFFSAQESSEEVRPAERAARPPILMVDDFYYPPQQDTLSYPTCELNKGFTFPGVGSSSLGDYGFLSAMAYETSNVTKYSLEKWFGGVDVMVDEEEFVADYRVDSGTTNNPVYFKLFSIPSIPGYAVMAIRGSETAFDWLVNMQLWSAAGLAQVVKWLTPFGWVWHPIVSSLSIASNFACSVVYSLSFSYFESNPSFQILLTGFLISSRLLSAT
jgi:lipase ATG15